MPYVYRYMDVFDNKYKYIGIVKGDTYSNLTRRIKQHRKEVWFKNSEFEVDYIEVPTICDAEAIEGSLIGKYQTYKYYNKAKKNWENQRYLKYVIMRGKYTALKVYNQYIVKQ